MGIIIIIIIIITIIQKGWNTIALIGTRYFMSFNVTLSSDLEAA